MSASRAVDPESFRVALAPMVTALCSFSAAVDDTGPRHSDLPAVDAPAMRELADERAYASRSSWTAPITDTHGLGAMTLRATADYARSFAEAFTAQRLPVYGHLVLARAALESAVVSWWLSEPEVAREERVKRGLSELLYSATEQGRLGLTDDAAEEVNTWATRARGLGWAATDRHGRPWSLSSRGRPQVDGVGRPATAAAMTMLLVGDNTSRIGALQWSRLSAVAHVTWFGLQSALLFDDRSDNAASGLSSVPVGTDSSAVSGQALCVVRLLRQAATARFTLMGWQDDTWNNACAAIEAHERTLLQAYRAGHA